jgi:hypothetical protein
MAAVRLLRPFTALDAIVAWKAANDPTRRLYIIGDTCAAVLDLPAGVRYLDISSCSGLRALPRLPASLLVLSCEHCPDLCALPDLATQCPQLETLQIENCPQLRALPNLSSLVALRELLVRACQVLRALPLLPAGLAQLHCVLCFAVRALPPLPA